MDTRDNKNLDVRDSAGGKDRSSETGGQSYSFVFRTTSASQTIASAFGFGADTSEPRRSIVERSTLLRSIIANWEFIEHCLIVIFAWGIISLTVILFSLYISIPINTFMFISSLCSLVSSGLILLSGYYSGKKHRTAFHYIYALSAAELVNAFRLFYPSAAVVLGGVDPSWQARNMWSCYLTATVGQICIVASTLWNFVIVLDLLLLIFSPLRYGFQNRQKSFYKTHVIIWGLGIISVIPALSAEMVGLYPNYSCFLLGDYHWSFTALWYAFIAFSICAVTAIAIKVALRSNKEPTGSRAYIKVVSQLSYMTLSFMLSWMFAIAFSYYSGGEVPPHWLVTVMAFWLGGTSILDAVIWIPFITTALRKAQRNMLQLFDPRKFFSNGSGDNNKGRDKREVSLVASDSFNSSWASDRSSEESDKSVNKSPANRNNSKAGRKVSKEGEVNDLLRLSESSFELSDDGGSEPDAHHPFKHMEEGHSGGGAIIDDVHERPGGKYSITNVTGSNDDIASTSQYMRSSMGNSSRVTSIRTNTTYDTEPVSGSGTGSNSGSGSGSGSGSKKQGEDEEEEPDMLDDDEFYDDFERETTVTRDFNEDEIREGSIIEASLDVISRLSMRLSDAFSPSGAAGSGGRGSFSLAMLGRGGKGAGNNDEDGSIAMGAIHGKDVESVRNALRDMVDTDVHADNDNM